MDNLTTDPNKILDPFADKKLNKMIDSFWQKSENNFKILNESASVLARHAIRLTRTSMGANACVITLGAISATSGAFSALYGEDNSLVILAYTIIGLAIATISGLDAAFKWESTSFGRNLLAGEVTGKINYFETEFNIIFIQASKYSDNSNVGEKVYNKLYKDLSEVLLQQAEYIHFTNQKAAELNVNLKWEIERAESYRSISSKIGIS